MNPRTRPRRLRALFTTAMFAIALSSVLLPAGAPAATVNAAVNAPPLPLLAVNAVARPDHSIEVSWQVSPVGPPTEYVFLWQWNMAGQTVSFIQVNADEPSKLFYVGTGDTIFLGSAANSAGMSPWTASQIVTMAAGCSTADICVNVDSSATPTTESLTAQGFNSSTRYGSTVVDPTLTSAVKPRNWRIGGSQYSLDAKAYGANRTFALSDQWLAATSPSHGGFAATPWSNWAGFSAWVTQTVLDVKAAGAAPEYWELFNEPDLLNDPATPYFASSDRSSATTANVLEMLRVEYVAIKAADPLAKIVAPSVSNYIDGVNASPNVVNMRTFVAYAAANNMTIDAVAWHELTDTASYQDSTTSPPVMADHVGRARRLFAKYPAIGTPLIFLNEYGHASSHLLPGWVVGQVAQIESTGVAQGNRTCWHDECWSAGLDGLLTKTGSTWQGTTAAYWTHRAYADMNGSTKMDAKSSMSWRMSGMAARDNATSTVRVLVGHHWYCAQSSGNTWCPSAFNGGPVSATVSVGWPYAGPTVDVQVFRLPAGIGPIAGPTLVSTTTSAVTGGRIAVQLPSVADGDAYSVVLKPHV